MKPAAWLGAQIGAAWGGFKAGATAVQKSFATDFLRGRDLDEAPAARRAFTQPYAQSAWVRSAVEAVANPISGRPLKFYDGDNEFADPRLAEFWAAPARGPAVLGVQPRLPLGDVLRDLASWERLEGETFILLEGEWLLATAPRAALPLFIIAHPGRMAAIVQGGLLAGWRYTDAGGRQHTLIPEQVIHHRSFNPYDDWRGLGSMQAARVAAEGAFLTGAYVRDLARNNGDQGMVVVAKGGVVSDPQREQILADLRAKRAALLRGQVKDLLLGGDITIDRPKEQAASAELMTSKGMSHEEVYVAFGVPPSLAAVKQAYSIGKESDKYQLITETCQPVGARVASSLAAVASRQAGRVLTAELEWDDHPVMIEVRNSRLESALKLWAVGMPIKHANDYLGLGMQPFPGWDRGFLPFSVSPVEGGELGSPKPGEGGDPATDPDLAEASAEADPAVEQLRLLVLARARTSQRACIDVTPKAGTPDPLAMFACGCGSDAQLSALNSQLHAKRSAKEVAQWRTLMAQRRDTVRSFQGGLGRVLMAARAETLRKLEASKSTGRSASIARSPEQAQRVEGSTSVAKAAAADFMFDLPKFKAGVLATLRDRQKAALKTAGQQLLEELGRDDAFAYPPEKVLDFLAARANKLADTPAAIFEQVKAALEEGLVAGETTAELSGRVRSAFNDISEGRAKRIALTETAAAYGAGRAEGMVQAGVQWKQWLTSGNDNVRSAHADANGQTVPVDESFTVDGEALAYPGDDAGSAGNVINCHCVSIASATGPEENS